MLNPSHTPSGDSGDSGDYVLALASKAPTAATGQPFFYPGQFPARAALAAVAHLARAHTGAQSSPSELARLLDLFLPARLGVQDLLRASEVLGLDARLQRVPPQELADMALPTLLLLPEQDHLPTVLVLAHCDGRYVVTHDHSSVIPSNAMGPLSMLASDWAPHGTGWVLTVSPRMTA